MHPSRSPALYHYKVGITTEALSAALKQKIQETLALGYDICTDFVINPRNEKKDVPHEHEGRTVLCVNNQGNFAIDCGVMNLMTRGKDLEGMQRFLRVAKETSPPVEEEETAPLVEEEETTPPVEETSPLVEEGKSNWCDDEEDSEQSLVEKVPSPDFEEVEATDYILQPLFFPTSAHQRAHLIADYDDPDQDVELYAIPCDIFYPDENKFLSWVLHVDCKDEVFIRSCVEPLVTSRVVRVDGRNFPGPVYVRQRDETFNVYFDRSTYDAARVVTVFSCVWRDNVTLVNARGEERKGSVAVNFRAQRVSAERFHLNELRSAVGFEPPRRKNAPKTRVESSWGDEEGTVSQSSVSQSSVPNVVEKKTEKTVVAPTVKSKPVPVPVEEPKKKYTGRYAGLFSEDE